MTDGAWMQRRHIWHRAGLPTGLHPLRDFYCLALPPRLHTPSAAYGQGHRRRRWYHGGEIVVCYKRTRWWLDADVGTHHAWPLATDWLDVTSRPLVNATESTPAVISPHHLSRPHFIWSEWLCSDAVRRGCDQLCCCGAGRCATAAGVGLHVVWLLRFQVYGADLSVNMITCCWSREPTGLVSLAWIISVTAGQQTTVCVRSEADYCRTKPRDTRPVDIPLTTAFNSLLTEL